MEFVRIDMTTGGGGDTEAAEEIRELEAMVEVLGDQLAQDCARKHYLPQLVDATQRGFWKA